MSLPRWSSKPAALRNESGYFTYIVTASRITFGGLSKNRNGLVDLAMANTLCDPDDRAGMTGLTELSAGPRQFAQPSLLGT